MTKKCIECEKKCGFFSKHNYAGLDVRKIVEDSLVHFFSPKQFHELKLPGNPTTDFLCASCASRRTVSCTIHGDVQSKSSGGLPPICHACKKSAKNRKCIDCNEIHQSGRMQEYGNRPMTCVEMFRFGIDEDLRFYNMAPYCNEYSLKIKI